MPTKSSELKSKPKKTGNKIPKKTPSKPKTDTPIKQTSPVIDKPAPKNAGKKDAKKAVTKKPLPATGGVIPKKNVSGIKKSIGMPMARIPSKKPAN